MQFDNQKTRNVADIAARIMAGESAQPQQLDEELKGNQHKIDANKNNKIDAHDFKLLRAQKEKEKANSMKSGKDVKEEVEELTESHFKVGDEVICKSSGMEGEVIKVDPKGEGKYYTVKQEDGTIKKFAPNELKKEEEEEKEEMKEATKQQETKFHKNLDKLVHKTFGKRKEEMKEENIDEAMFPGTKEYQKKYGESPQQKLRKKGDTTPTSQGEMKKTDKGVMHTRKFSEMIQTYNEIGLKMIAEMKIQEEPDNEQHTQEVEKAKAKNRGEDRNDKNIAAGKVDAVKVEEETELDEREMTDAEMKKREEIVKSMKKGMQGFKDRYGERAKSVMYATAAKIAKEKA